MLVFHSSSWRWKDPDRAARCDRIHPMKVEYASRVGPDKHVPVTSSHRCPDPSRTTRYLDDHNRNPSTHHTSVVLEVEVDTVGSSPGLALTDDNGGHDLLSQLGLSLLDGSHDHVTDTGSGQTVQASTDTLDGDDVQVTGTGVVAAVHHGAAKR